MESARLIAGLTRMLRDVGMAEELAQDALGDGARALAEPGRAGQPRRVVMATRQAAGDRRAERSKRLTRKHEELGTSSKADAAFGQRRTGAQARKRRWMTKSATICCGCCSSRVTPCCRWKRGRP